MEKVTPRKGAKMKVKRLQPNAQYLFGGKVGEITKALKDCQELNPLAVGGNSFNSSGRGGNSLFYSNRG